MQARSLGRTGLQVSPLGFGAAQIGYVETPQEEIDKLLNGLLDLGITLIDTAHCYPTSEEKIGKAIAGRRNEYVLVSKCGHASEADDPPSWTAENIRHDAEVSLRRMKTDHLDVLLLHSCGVDALRNQEMIEALSQVKRDGLTRFIGYSGDNEPAELAISMDVFDVLETSLSICDQHVLNRALPMARQADFGVLTKRSIANACWRDLSKYDDQGFYDQYAAEYTRRLGTMGIHPESLNFDGNWLELALRFTAFQPGVSCAIIGGRSLDHLRENIQILEQGPLPEQVEQGIRQAWQQHDDGNWSGQT